MATDRRRSPAPPAAAAGPSPTLRVMRLYHAALPLGTAEPALPSTCSDARVLCASAASGGGPGCDGFLRLPDSFGSIYRGETFRAYVSVLNDLDCALYDVQMSAKLQAPGDVPPRDLGDSRDEDVSRVLPAPSAATLPGGESMDMVARARLDDLGTHTLRVTVTYFPLPQQGEAAAAAAAGGAAAAAAAADPLSADHPLAEPPPAPPPPPVAKTLRKFYRFNVLAPLAVQCAVTPGRAVGGSVVTAAVRNLTEGPVLLRSVSLEPPDAAPFSARPLQTAAAAARDAADAAAEAAAAPPPPPAAAAAAAAPSADLLDMSFAGDGASGAAAEDWQSAPSALELFDRLVVLQPQEVHQAAFVVAGAAQAPPPGSSLGLVRVAWASTTGEHATFEAAVSVALDAAAPARDVELAIEGLPSTVPLGAPVEIGLAATNLWDRALHLQVHLAPSAARATGAAPAALQPVGKSLIDLGRVLPGATGRGSATIVPLRLGLQSLSDITVVDAQTAREFEQGPPQSVLVTKEVV